jgi:hypothetical protein
MDDQKHAVQAPGRLKTRRVAADGIVGRLTYTPALGDEVIGQMRRNRVKDDGKICLLPSWAWIWMSHVFLALTVLQRPGSSK